MRKPRRVQTAMTILLAAGVLGATATAARAADTPDQSIAASSSYYEGLSGPSGGGGQNVAQTFTAGVSGALDRVALDLQSSGGVNADPVEVELVNASGGAPGATVLATGTIAAGAVTTTVGWLQASFATPAEVTAGTQYAVVTGAGGSDVLRWYDASSAYSGGHGWYASTSSPTRWTALGQSQSLQTWVATPPVASPSTTALSFPTQAQSTASAPQTVTVTDTGDQDLEVNGLTLTGADAADFQISSQDCPTALASDESCDVTVRFLPRQQGVGTAVLEIDSNAATATVSLTGTGGPAAESAGGTTPTIGTTVGTATMPTTGSTGSGLAPQPAGGVEIVTCRLVASGAGHRAARCSVRQASHATGAAVTHHLTRAWISRGHRRYATGIRIAARRGVARLRLVVPQPLAPGRYRLTLRVWQGHRWVTRRRMITIS